MAFIQEKIRSHKATHDLAKYLRTVLFARLSSPSSFGVLGMFLAPSCVAEKAEVQGIVVLSSWWEFYYNLPGIFALLLWRIGVLVPVFWVLLYAYLLLLFFYLSPFLFFYLWLFTLRSHTP